MKRLKNLFKRKQSFQEYGHEIYDFNLQPFGSVQYAGWLHPSESKKDINQSLIDLYQELIQPGDTVIDIGAHTGDTTVPMALCAGREGMTFALEPNPYVYKILAQNAELNPTQTRITALNFAATETDGEYTFHYSDAAYCNGGYLSQIQNQRHGHHYPLVVQGRNLVTYLEQNYPAYCDKVRFIKTDTEGYDYAVLTSLRPIIERNRPIIVAEVLKKLSLAERTQLFRFFDDLNYECQFFDWTSTTGEKITEQKLMLHRHYDILARPR